MAHLSSDGKQAIILKAVNRGNTPLRDIATANNVGLSTLQRWLNAYQAGNVPWKLTSVKPHPLTPHEMQQHISATEGLQSVAKSAYCRQHGLYSHEVDQWKEELKKNSGLSDKTYRYKAEIAELKNKYKALEKEISRKDKALSDASTLLILKKKAELIWGEIECPVAQKKIET